MSWNLAFYAFAGALLIAVVSVESADDDGLAPVTRSNVKFLNARSGCDSNYAGGCVPIARDVDCAGGAGNGPAFVRGPVRVVGRDIYGLDTDGDGRACEPLR